eukprot:9495903-Pyramimonas_sp.AAC.1
MKKGCERSPGGLLCKRIPGGLLSRSYRSNRPNVASGWPALPRGPQETQITDFCSFLVHFSISAFWHPDA